MLEPSGATTSSTRLPEADSAVQPEVAQAVVAEGDEPVSIESVDPADEARTTDTEAEDAEEPFAIAAE